MSDFTIPFESNPNQTLPYHEAIECYQKMSNAHPRVFQLNAVGSTDRGEPLHVAVLSASGEFNPETSAPNNPQNQSNGPLETTTFHARSIATAGYGA